MESIHNDVRTTPVYGLIKALALNNISSTNQKITATKYSNRFHPTPSTISEKLQGAIKNKK